MYVFKICSYIAVTGSWLCISSDSNCTLCLRNMFLVHFRWYGELYTAKIYWFWNLRFKWTFSLIDISSKKRQQNQSLSDSLSLTAYFLSKWTTVYSFLMNDCVPSQAKPGQRANNGRDLLESQHPSVCLAIPAYYFITGLSNRHLILCWGLCLCWRFWV
jgi:hypothetical protein